MREDEPRFRTRHLSSLSFFLFFEIRRDGHFGVAEMKQVRLEFVL